MLYTKGKWSKEELAILYSYYSVGGAELCYSKGINRSLISIKQKANSVGLKLQTNPDSLSEKELAILKKYYPKGGYLLCLNMGLLHPNKNIVRSAVNKLGLKVKDYNPINFSEEIWMESEIWLLCKYFGVGGSALCIAKGLNRSPKSILSKASRLNLSTNVRGSSILWEDWEDKILESYYSVGGSKMCKDKGLNRGLDAIQTRANKLGYRRYSVVSNNHINGYAKWEEDIIREYYPTEGAKGCRNRGIDRNTDAIILKAQRMGLRCVDRVHRDSEWSDIEKRILSETYPIYGAKGCIAEGLNRSERAIQHKTAEFGLRRIIKGNWTKQEDDILKEYYPKGGYNLCVEKGLKRKPDATRNRAKFWGLIYSKNR